MTLGGKSGWRTAQIATNSLPLRLGPSPHGVAELFCRRVPDTNPAGSKQNLSCRWPRKENRNASVLMGVLWWHPQATDFEVHIRVDREQVRLRGK